MNQKDFLIENGKLVGYYGKDECITVPAGIREIGGWAFANDARIKEVILSEGVTTIDALAFEHCHRLRKVVLPQSLREIGHHAFYDCPALEDIFLHDGIEILGSEIFKGCRALAEPRGFIILGDRLHQYCGESASVRIPEGITEISRGAFERCESLKNILLPNSLRIIGERAFMGCKNLEKIYIPNGVTEIGEWALANCTSMKYLVIPDTVQTLGKNLISYSKNIGCVHVLSENDPLYDVFDGTGLTSFPLCQDSKIHTLAYNQTVAVLGFVIAKEEENRDFPEEDEKAARLYLRRYRKKFYAYFETYDCVWQYMIKHSLIPAADVPDLVFRIDNTEIRAALLQYSFEQKRKKPKNDSDISQS
ncbi:MAG: leucine-rich repeat domain-containing protein [Clostridia bacterium]|nr:leucine-rich repeat domain-containing protein [Clostridia bacterium]